MSCRVEHERCRKQLKEIWNREVRKMQEAVTNMRKAKSAYNQRLEEYQKSPLGLAHQARAASSTSASEADSDVKPDHKKRVKEEDLHQKVFLKNFK